MIVGVKSHKRGDKGGIILQPGFVYGSRVTDGKVVIPLGWLGYPMEVLFNLPTYKVS